MIQQTQYKRPTTKYNFPLTIREDTPLSTRFKELSIQSMKNMQNAETTIYQPNENTTEYIVTNPTTEVTPIIQGQTKLKLNAIKLKPSQEEMPVVAIDVSSIRIGETITGIILALRGAIVWRKKRQYLYQRIGPLPFHITEENKTEINQLFRQYNMATNEDNQTSVPSLTYMQTRLTTLFERCLQSSLTSQSQGTLILLDGSLIAGTHDTPVTVLEKLLETARNRLNTILAFSKMTRLRISGQRLTDLIKKCAPPCLLKVEGYPTALSTTIRFLGNIFVVKLSQGNISFRLDIDYKLDYDQAIEATQRLIFNDLLLESYPETLRLAHIYSTFTANEVIGIQRFLAQNYNIRTTTRPNIRRLLFGPYGKGPEGA